MLLSTFAITLVIYLTDLAKVPPLVLREARTAVAEILRDIDVTVQWAPASESASRGPDAILLTILPYESVAFRSHDRVVMGTAARTPRGMRTAWVYYQRVLEGAHRHSVPPAVLLACAMAHEIGHLLQTSPGHEPDGLMKSVWTAGDFRRMSMGRLRFTTVDR